jgi:hypothetical protein
VTQLAEVSLVCLLALSLAACGKSDEPDDPRPQAAGQAPASVDPPPAAAPAPAPKPRAGVSTEDIDRWQRGLAAEKKAVQDAAAKLATAKDDNAKMEAMLAASDMGTAEAGAKAAGVDLDTYRRIGQTLSTAVAQFSPMEMEMNLGQMPPAAIEQFRQAREAGVARVSKELPPEVIEALKARAAELRRQDLELVGERLKVAQSAR